MSYLLFGRIGNDSSEQTNSQQTMERQAARLGFNIFVGEQIPQHIVAEMLNEQIGPTSGYSFLITSRVSEDTSDTMISPFECTPAQITEALISVEEWGKGVLSAMPTIKLSLFFTDGYDTTFARQEVSMHGWAKQLAKIIKREGYIPSSRIELMR